MRRKTVIGALLLIVAVAVSAEVRKTPLAQILGVGTGVASVQFKAPSDGVLTLTNNAGTDFTRLQFGGTTASFPALQRNGANLNVMLADASNLAQLNAGVITTVAGAPLYVGGVSGTQVNDSHITVGAGTGITVATPATVARTVYKVTVASTAFVCAGVTCDVTIATLPAKTTVHAVWADLTAVFACASVCTSAQLTGSGLGSAAGGTQYLATAMDLHTAPKQFGLLDADLGTLLVRAAAIQGGAMSWAGNIVSFRLASGVGNIGTGAATNLSTGSITFWLETTRLP